MFNVALWKNKTTIYLILSWFFQIEDKKGIAAGQNSYNRALCSPAKHTLKAQLRLGLNDASMYEAKNRSTNIDLNFTLMVFLWHFKGKNADVSTVGDPNMPNSAILSRRQLCREAVQCVLFTNVGAILPLKCHQWVQIAGRCIYYIWLVVSNMNFIFHHIWDVILPIDVHIFQRGWNHQPDIILYIYVPVISWFISPSNYSYKYHKP